MSARLCNSNILWKKFMGVCVDVGLKMFRSQSEFIAKIKQKTLIRLDLVAWFTKRLLSSKTLHIVMKDKFATIIRVVNYVKASAVNIKLFTTYMDSNHETLLFHTSFRCLSNVNMVARLYKMKNELMLLLKLTGNSIFLVNKIKRISSDVGKPCWYFSGVKWFKFDFAGQEYQLYQWLRCH